MKKKACNDERYKSFETIPIDRLQVDERHIRKTRSDIGMLTRTISDVGLLQPILVRKSGDMYTVVDGERRLRALKDLKVPELIVGRDLIIDAEEKEADMRFKQVIANVQREDINDIELGHAFVMLKDEYGYQYKEIAEIIGKTPHYITAKVGLAKRLTPELQEVVVCDIESARCIQNTFLDDFGGEQPYQMNVNVLEDIARLPPELQRPAYDLIRAREMDKKEALEYLRLVKRDAEVMKLADDVKGLMLSYHDETLPEASGLELARYLKKLDRDLEQLSSRVKVGGMEREKVILMLEHLITRLNSLYMEVKTSENVADETLA